VSAVDLSTLQRPNDRLWRRRALNRGMEVLAWTAAAIAVAILGIVVWSVAKRGASELNWDLFTKTPVSFAIGNEPQGLANAFAGSLVIVGVAAVVYLLVSLVFGRGEELAPLPPGATLTRLPAHELAGADIRAVKFQQALRGYKMSEVDWVLDRLAGEVDTLRARVDELSRLRLEGEAKP